VFEDQLNGAKGSSEVDVNGLSLKITVVKN
jgi:hypothetical protein